MKLHTPETVKPGDIVETQISPFGTFPAQVGKTRIDQICDRVAFDRIVAAFNKEVLVDFEHNAENGGDTTAAAWIQSVRVDPEKGLIGAFKYTDVGAEAVTNRRLRFLSPVWYLGADGRPERLVSVALTNKPNISVHPVLNRETGTTTVQENEDPAMQKIATLLGLAETATEEEILAAIGSLVSRVSELETAANTAEAEKTADEHKELIANRQQFVELYVKNKEAAKSLLATLKPRATPPTVVLNKAAAQKPSFAAPGANAESDPQAVLNKWKAMPEGDEKDNFLVTNKAAILAAHAKPTA